MAEADGVPLRNALDPSSSAPFIDYSYTGLRRRVVDAAWPQTLVVFARTANEMVNVIILGHLGTSELAGSAFASIVTAMSSIILRQGLGDALITLSSQAIGAGNPKLAGVWLQTSVLAISLTSIPVGVCWWFTEDILRLAGDSGPGEDVRPTYITCPTQPPPVPTLTRSPPGNPLRWAFR